jgi:hypothetical protein
MDTFADSVTILGLGVELGGFAYSAGAPTSAARVGWPIDNGQVTPSYDGYVHFEGFSRCGRVDLRIKDENGVQLAEVPGPQHCPPDLAHYAYRDTLNSYTSPLAAKVEVRLETKSGGTWNKRSPRRPSPSPSSTLRRSDGSRPPAAAVAPQDAYLRATNTATVRAGTVNAPDARR